MLRIYMYHFSLIAILIVCSCSNTQKETINESDAVEVKKLQPTEVKTPIIDKLLDSLQLEGVILIYDETNNQYLSNNFQEAKQQVLPASTFKIPNTIIGLETGNIESEETVFKWDGNQRAFPMWEKDLVLRDAFQFSCVPCYQGLALQIGVDTMQHYLKKLEFGQMDVNQKTLDNFWLIGTSKISPNEQVEFLRKLYHHDLAISERTQKIITNIMSIDQSDQYHLSGKTGWAAFPDKNIGWFVGFIEKANDVYFFATKVEPQEGFDIKDFPRIRKELTLEAFKKLQIIKSEID